MLDPDSESMNPDPKHTVSLAVIWVRPETKTGFYIFSGFSTYMDPNPPENGLDSRLLYAQTKKQIRADQNMACIRSTDKSNWSKPENRSGLIRNKQCCGSALVSMRIRIQFFYFNSDPDPDPGSYTHAGPYRSRPDFFSHRKLNFYMENIL